MLKVFRKVFEFVLFFLFCGDPLNIQLKSEWATFFLFCFPQSTTKASNKSHTENFTLFFSVTFANFFQPLNSTQVECLAKPLWIAMPFMPLDPKGILSILSTKKKQPMGKVLKWLNDNNHFTNHVNTKHFLFVENKRFPCFIMKQFLLFQEQKFVILLCSNNRFDG